MKLEKKKKADLIKMLNAAKPELDLFEMEKLSWIALPFLPEDLLFKEYMQDDKEHGTLRIYTRDGVSCMRIDDHNTWVVKTPDFKMNFKINSKFHAYQLFTMIGLKIDPFSSSVPDDNRTVQEILKDAKNEEE